MKKQIFTLTFFVLAIFASNKLVHAQNLTSAPASCITPTPIAATCIVDDEFHPMAGQAYSYTVSVPTPSGTKSFNWLVTQDKTFIDNTGLIASPESKDGTGDHIATASGTYNAPPGSETVDITWKAFTHDASNPVFLVIYVTNDDGSCSTDNIQVYVIEPVHTFTLDIANLNADGSAVTGANSSCVSTVQSAIWDATNSAVTMDYGENYLYFQVVAANFSDSWMPTFQVTGIDLSGTTIADVAWAYPDAATSGPWHTTTEASNIYTPTDAVEAKDASGTVGATGECIVVRVHVDHNSDETLIDIPVKLAVNGIMANPTTGDYTTASYADIHYEADGSGNCPWYDDYTNDFVTHTITARPDIQDATGASSGATFLPKN